MEKNYKKLSIHALIIVVIILLAAISLSAGFAATTNINNSTSGGISGALNSSSSGDTIILDEGTYRGNNNTNISITKNITIQGKTKDKVIIDAQGLSRMFDLGDFSWENTEVIAQRVTFINITFINGNGYAHIVEGNQSDDWGGAILNRYWFVQMTFINCTFINNTAGYGGAILNNGVDLLVVNCVFNNNTAEGVGAAIRNTNHNMTVSNSTFSGNEALHGVLYSSGCLDAIVENCVFKDNFASYGMLSINSNIPRTTSAIIRNCTFTNNSNGAIFADTHEIGAPVDVYLTVVDCTFNDNKNFKGGAIQIEGPDGTGTVYANITNCTFTNNFANIGNHSYFGGAIYNNGITNVTNCTFTNNFAAGCGGAIYNNGSMSVMGNTMTGNSAGLGQMIYNNGYMGILNLTFINNSTWIVRNGSTITLYVTLLDDMGNTVTGQNISFYINGVFYENVTSIEGYSNITYKCLIVDIIPVSGEYAGRGDYNILINNGLLIVWTSTNSTVTAPNGKVGRQSTINGVATDENGNIMANTQLTVTIDGVSYTVTTDSSGAWSLNITPTGAGNFNVVVSWVGNATHENFTNSTIFSVAGKTVTNSTVAAPNGKVGQQSTISGVAKDEDNNPIANTQLTVTINGVSYTVITNAVGAWSLNITLTGAGNFNVVVSWAGNATHENFTNTTVFVVAKIGSNSTVVAPNGKVGQNTTITGVATDENGNPIANTQLLVVVDGQSYNVTTDSSGAWSLNVTPNTAGNFNVVVSWAGNSTHKSFTNSTSFLVLKIPTNTTVETDKDKITATLTDEDGNPLANKELTITVNGKTYKKTTNSKGEVTIKYKNAWDYKVTANFKEDNQYLGSKASAPKRTPTKITINKKGNKVIVTLKDNKGKVLAYKTIKVVIDGQEFVGTTDENGQFTIQYKNPEKFTITARFDGDDMHIESEAALPAESEPIADAKTNAPMKETGLPVIPVLLSILGILGLGIVRK